MGHNHRPPARPAPCDYPACRHGGTWLVFTPDDRYRACAVHLAYVIITSGSRHAAVEQVAAPVRDVVLI